MRARVVEYKSHEDWERTVSGGYTADEIKTGLMPEMIAEICLLIHCLIHCMFSAETLPPFSRGMIKLTEYPGQLPVVFSVEGQGF